MQASKIGAYKKALTVLIHTPSLSELIYFNLHSDHFQFQISSPNFSLELLCMHGLTNMFTWLSCMFFEHNIFTTEFIVLATEPSLLVVSQYHSLSHKTKILSKQVQSISRPLLASHFTNLH